MVCTITLFWMSVRWHLSRYLHIFVLYASLAVLPLLFFLAERYFCFWPSWRFIQSSMGYFIIIIVISSESLQRQQQTTPLDYTNNSKIQLFM